MYVPSAVCTYRDSCVTAIQSCVETRAPSRLGALVPSPGVAMAHDRDRVRDFAQSYTDAWCSHDPAQVAGHYTPGGTIAINGGEPTAMTDVARAFMEAFPDIQVFMDDVVFKDESVEYHWT